MRLRTRLLLAIAYVLLLAIVSLQIPLVVALRDRTDSQVRFEAERQADVVAVAGADLVHPPAHSRLRRLVDTSARSIRGRVLIADRRGRVLADSGGPSTIGRSYASRPEVRAALRGRQFQGQRFSRSLGRQLLATAVPLVESGRTVGVVRITQSVAAVDHTLNRITLEIVLVGVAVLILGLVAGAIIARHVARPLARLESAARRVAGGELDAQAAEDLGSVEQRSLARSFNEMTARLGRLLESQRRFVADASHQLRTPLTGVRLRVEEARAAGVEASAARELEAAAAEVDRMAAIVDELLVLSRAGERASPGEDIDLGEALERAEDRWAPAAEAAGVRLVVDRTGRPGVVRCARADLDRALDALVENALAYGGDEVELAAEGDSIEIRDRGPGLAPDEAEAIWDRFHRGRAGSAGPRGTGLGLSIARELAQEWGARAELSNREGGGAVAALRFGGVHA